MSAVSTPPAVSGAPRSDLRRDLGLVGWQIRYEQRQYWRNRGRGVFTFVFPIMFLVIFAAINRHRHLDTLGGITFDEFFVPGILAYGVIATTYVNMAISTSVLRDEGILKRMQATPLPRWAYVLARVGSTVLITLAMTVLTLAIGALVYGVRVRAATLPGLIATLVLGTAAFTTLGIGVVRFIPTAEAAPVYINLSVLPLTFISNVWFPTTSMPSALKSIANAFPIRPLADSLEYAFNPHSAGPGLHGHDLLVLAIWTVIGVRLMARFMRQPHREG